MMQSPNLGQIPTEQAVRLFWQMMNNGWFQQLWAWILHKPTKLLELDVTLCCQQVRNSHYAGIHTVNINCIKGTEGKADAFDAAFHPIKEITRSRWISIAREKLKGQELPLVELVDVDGVYDVRDGHHRISVVRSLGQNFIGAEITAMDLLRHL
jgi:hypothetical protein